MIGGQPAPRVPDPDDLYPETCDRDPQKTSRPAATLTRERRHKKHFSKNHKTANIFCQQFFCDFLKLIFRPFSLGATLVFPSITTRGTSMIGVGRPGAGNARGTGVAAKRPKSPHRCRDNHGDTVLLVNSLVNT